MSRRKHRVNVLLITCDQWRGDCLSAAGHPTVRTPNADALAHEGVLFRRHYAGAAPCGPARACLYTGLYQMNNRVCRNGTPLDARHDNLALAARRLGYEPTLFGYTDVTPDPRDRSAVDPALRGYEGVLPGFTVRQALPEHQKPWLSWLAAQGLGVGMGFPDIHRSIGGDPNEVPSDPPVYGREHTPAAFLAGEFIRWLGEQEEPWFAHVSFISPHPPFVVPEPFNRMHDPADGPPFRRAATLKAERRLHPYVRQEIDRVRRAKFVIGAKGKVSDWSEGAFRRLRALYCGMIAEVDAQLGRLWEALRKRGAWDDTLVVLTSDHAEMMGDHFLLGKGGFFDGSFHIPLIIRDPRLPGKAVTIDEFTETVDIMPTLQALLGGEVLPHLDGRSLHPFLQGEFPKDWRSEAHWEFDFRSIAERDPEKNRLGLPPRRSNLAVIRSRSFKYVHFGGGLPPLLFDLEADPDETVNLADDPSCVSVRLDHAERLLDWRARHLDQSLALCSVGENGIIGSFARRQ